MRYLALCAASSLLSGCLVTTAPLEVGKDTYSITSTADGFRSGTAADGRALIRGRQFCESKGKKFLVSTDQTARTRAGIDTTVSVTFKCLDPSDPEYAKQ
jgi:hypothetical protein